MAIDLRAMGQRAVAAGQKLGLMSTEARNAVLEGIARRLEGEALALAEANEADLAQARADGLPPALLDRLALTPKRLAGNGGWLP